MNEKEVIQRVAEEIGLSDEERGKVAAFLAAGDIARASHIVSANIPDDKPGLHTALANAVTKPETPGGSHLMQQGFAACSND